MDRKGTVFCEFGFDREVDFVKLWGIFGLDAEVELVLVFATKREANFDKAMLENRQARFERCLQRIFCAVLQLPEAAVCEKLGSADGEKGEFGTSFVFAHGAELGDETLVGRECPDQIGSGVDTAFTGETEHKAQSACSHGDFAIETFVLDALGLDFVEVEAKIGLV